MFFLILENKEIITFVRRLPDERRIVEVVVLEQRLAARQLDPDPVEGLLAEGHGLHLVDHLWLG